MQGPGPEPLPQINKIQSEENVIAHHDQILDSKAQTANQSLGTRTESPTMQDTPEHL